MDFTGREVVVTGGTGALGRAVVAAAVIAIACGPFTGIHWDQVLLLGLLLAASESTATLLSIESGRGNGANL